MIESLLNWFALAVCFVPAIGGIGIIYDPVHPALRILGVPFVWLSWFMLRYYWREFKTPD